MTQAPIRVTYRNQEGEATLYPLECQQMTRLLNAGGGYFIFGDENRNLGLMDWHGKVIIQPMWEGVHPYIDQNVVVCDKGHVKVLLNLKGETLTGLQLHALLAEKKRGVTVITKGAQPLVCEELGDFLEGLARVRCAGEWGYVNSRGHYIGTVINANGTGDFGDSLAPVLRGKGLFKKGKIGYIDKTLADVIAPQYDGAYGFSEGFAPVHTASGWGYIRKDGTPLSCYETVKGERKEIRGFTQAEMFEGGYARVLRFAPSATLPAGDGIMLSLPQDVSGWGLLNREGELCVPCVFNRLSDVLPCGLCLFETAADEGKAPKYGIIDTKGRVRYSSYRQLYPVGEQYFTFEADGKHYIIDTMGRLISETGFEEVGSRFTGNTVSVKQNGRWGAMSRIGKMVMPAEYDHEFNLYDGVALVSKNDQGHLVNKRGEALCDIVFSDAANLTNGLALAELDGVRYLVDFGYGRQFELEDEKDA